jgi:hypothetical protein
MNYSKLVLVVHLLPVIIYSLLQVYPMYFFFQNNFTFQRVGNYLKYHPSKLCPLCNDITGILWIVLPMITLLSISFLFANCIVSTQRRPFVYILSRLLIITFPMMLVILQISPTDQWFSIGL